MSNFKKKKKITLNTKEKGSAQTKDIITELLSKTAIAF